MMMEAKKMSLKARILSALPFSRSELETLIATAPFRYKEYLIPKREIGKYREISQPTPEVKLIQRWLIKEEFSSFRVHSAATAYKEDVGLISNIFPHINNKFLLKIDFKNFFPSITATAFSEAIRGGQFSDEDIKILCNFLFKLDRKSRSLRLAIGAPSSPTISNILLYPLDEAIHTQCAELGISYTRYADDLSFSTNQPKILTEFDKNLPELINKSTNLNLRINNEKTVHASKKSGRKITGLVITSDNHVSIGREKKRKLRTEIHRFESGKLDQEQINSLKGYLSFLNSVEPDHIDRLKVSYGNDVMTQLLTN